MNLILTLSALCSTALSIKYLQINTTILPIKILVSLGLITSILNHGFSNKYFKYLFISQTYLLFSSNYQASGEGERENQLTPNVKKINEDKIYYIKTALASVFDQLTFQNEKIMTSQTLRVTKIEAPSASYLKKINLASQHLKHEFEPLRGAVYEEVKNPVFSNALVLWQANALRLTSFLTKKFSGFLLNNKIKLSKKFVFSFGYMNNITKFNFDENIKTNALQLTSLATPRLKSFNLLNASKLHVKMTPNNARVQARKIV